jgi:hypothetical protein
MMNCNCTLFSQEGNSLPVTIGACQLGWLAYTAGIKFEFIKWIRKNRGVSTLEGEQAEGGRGIAGLASPVLWIWMDGPTHFA